MFSGIQEIVDKSIEVAHNIQKKKIDRYEKATTTILEFCRNHNLFIQKNYLGRGLLNIIAYSRDPLRHSNNLTNELDKASVGTDFDGYIVLKTLIAKEQFAIDVDSFRMVIVKKITRDLDTILSTYITGDEKRIPPELEMIDLFQRIYNPYTESILSEVLEHIDLNLEKIDAVEGGTDDKKTFLEVNSNIFKSSRFILLGEHAWDALTNKKRNFTSQGDIVSFISDYSPEETIQRLENMSTEAYNFREYDLMLPSDNLIKKYSLTHSGKTVAIFYNSTRYELVPYKEVNGVKCAIAPVLLRFLYIDLYVFRIIQLRQGLEEKSTGAIMSRTKNAIKRIIAHKDNNLFFSNKWFGTLRNEVTENVKVMLASPEKFYPYYPRNYKESKKEYRKI